MSYKLMATSGSGDVDVPYLSDIQVALVTKYMAGGSLYDLLVHSKSPQFDAEGTVRHSALRLVKLASEAAAGVAHLHAHGIIHRDLACRNLLVDEGASSVAVADFGFARLRAKVHAVYRHLHTSIRHKVQGILLPFYLMLAVHVGARNSFYFIYFVLNGSTDRTWWLFGIKMWTCSVGSPRIVTIKTVLRGH